MAVSRWTASAQDNAQDNLTSTIRVESVGAGRVRISFPAQAGRETYEASRFDLFLADGGRLAGIAASELGKPASGFRVP